MKEARIIFPIGNQEIFTQAMLRLKLVFGGYTIFRGRGGWKGFPDEVVYIVEVAYWPSAIADKTLWDIADNFRVAANQEAVYLRYGNGHVQMVMADTAMDNGDFQWEELREALHKPGDDPDDVPEEHGVNPIEIMDVH